MAGFLEPLVHPILSPLLNLPEWLAILILSFSISLMITLVYKMMTDQDLMKQLKTEMKEFQKEIKELRDNPEKAMKVQKEAMETNMKYMTLSMKPTLFTFIPIIIIFGWMSAHLAYEPIMPGEEFTVTATFDKGTIGTIEIIETKGIDILSNAESKISNDQAVWKLKADAGTYFLKFKYKEETYEKELLITESNSYSDVETRYSGTELKNIKNGNTPVKPLPFPLFGWNPGWLGTYILMSLGFSMSIRKLLKVH